MKLRHLKNETGFSIGEMMMAVTLGSLILAATISASVALQKSLSAVDGYFATHIQQIRIIDYLSRDVRRSYIVYTAPDQQTVTCTVPNYIIAAGDSDAGQPGVTTGVSRRTPTVTLSANGATVNYNTRTMIDGVTINGSAVLVSPTGAFTAADVSQPISGSGIPGGTTVASFTNATTVTLSNNATATSASATVTVGPQSTVVYSVSGQSILRTENNTVTTIASSTQQLVPTTTDTELANTEYTVSAVTFLPTFNFHSSSPPPAGDASVAGTTVYARSHLRNKRRG